MKTNIRRDIKNFLLGQDAELALLTGGGNPAPFEGDIKAEFGLDGVTGANRICEIRTVPSECPIEIVNHIHQVFKRKIKMHPKVLKYNWQAGSFKVHAIGGHIHAGYDINFIQPEILNRIISNYAGALSLAIEDREEAHNRRNADEKEYGFLDDWRPQKWGMESRCFSSWLVSPQIALAHLCLFKTIVYEVLNNKSFNATLRFNNDDFYDVNIQKVRENFEPIWSEITQMALYKQYREYIDLFKFLIQNNLTWYPKDADVKVAWGLCDNSITMPVAPKPEVVLNLQNFKGNFKGNPIFKDL